MTTLEQRIEEGELLNAGEYWFERAKELQKEINEQPTFMDACCDEPNPTLTSSDDPTVSSYPFRTFTCTSCGTRWRPMTIGIDHYSS